MMANERVPLTSASDKLFDTETTGVALTKQRRLNVTAKAKQKKTGDLVCVADRAAARRGGDGTIVLAFLRASTESCSKSKKGDKDDATDDTDLSVVRRHKQKRRLNGEASEKGVDFAPCSAGHKPNGRSILDLTPTPGVNGRKSNGKGGDFERVAAVVPASTCRSLQELQRRKVATLKSRLMLDNQLAAIVSTEMGYHAGQDEAERKAHRAKAVELIEAIDKRNVPTELQVVADRVSGLVTNSLIARDGFDLFLKGIEKEMCVLAAALSTAQWINGIRGVGLKSLATIVGEAGDLSNYANPAKLWKRLGLAPFNGKMPSTWRFGKEGSLTSEQWSELGYSPRRRSVMYVIGECIVKQNDGAYRARYDEAKTKAAESHPDWSKGRCHNHGMLLATKRLVLDLWKQWCL